MSEQMRAAVLHAPGKLVVEQVAVPEIGPDDVLLRVSPCGVCGSDIPRVLTTGTYHFPTIPGHEFGGRVVKTGKHVEPSLVGRRAAVIPLIPCRKCSMCEVGAFALCEAYDFLGSRSDGGFAEYVRVPAQNLVFVPDEVDDDSTAFLEPISVALHVIENCGVSYGDTVAVYGLGAIGVFVAQWAKVFGAKTVYAVDLDPKKIEVANQLGLYGVNSAETDAEAFLKAQGGVDRVFEASGAPAVFNQALRVLRPSGVLGLVGRPTKPLEIQGDAYEKLLRGQLTIKGTWSFEFKRFPKHAWETSLEALRTGKIQTAPIISHRLPLEKTLDAVKLMAEHSEPFYKILINPALDRA